MTPELYRPLALDQLRSGPTMVLVEANAAECAALALRLRLPAIAHLSCEFRLTPGFAGTIDATGHLRARLVQTCVVTLDDFTADIVERFIVRFVPSGRESFDPDPEAIDEIPYDRELIDLGEAAAEQLALILDPYPRRPGVAMPADDNDIDSAELDSVPFAALAALKLSRRAD